VAIRARAAINARAIASPTRAALATRGVLVCDVNRERAIVRFRGAIPLSARAIVPDHGVPNTCAKAGMRPWFGGLSGVEPRGDRGEVVAIRPAKCASMRFRALQDSGHVFHGRRVGATQGA